MIALASIFGSWDGARALRNELWMSSWWKQNNCRMVVFDQGDDRTVERAEYFGYDVIRNCKTFEAETGIEGRGLAMNRMFEMLDAKYGDCEGIGVVNDSIPGCDQIGEIVEHFIKDYNPRSCFFVRHIDLENWAPDLKNNSDSNIESLRAAVVGRGRMHFPGAGMFVWPRSYFTEVAKSCAPLNYLYGGSEEYFWTRTLNDDAILIDISPSVHLIHLCHGPATHRAPKDGIGDPEKTTDPQIKHIYKFIPRTVQEIWDRVEPKLSVFDNGFTVIECLKKKGN